MVEPLEAKVAQIEEHQRTRLYYSFEQAPGRDLLVLLGVFYVGNVPPLLGPNIEDPRQLPGQRLVWMRILERGQKAGHLLQGALVYGHDFRGEARQLPELVGLYALPKKCAYVFEDVAQRLDALAGEPVVDRLIGDLKARVLHKPLEANSRQSSSWLLIPRSTHTNIPAHKHIEGNTRGLPAPLGTPSSMGRICWTARRRNSSSCPSPLTPPAEGFSGPRSLSDEMFIIR